jgi:hypothetical protein
MQLNGNGTCVNRIEWSTIDDRVGMGMKRDEMKWKGRE